MIALDSTHQTTPGYYNPASSDFGRAQNDLRVLIDEIATMRGLTIQMSLRLMSLCAAPNTEILADLVTEYAAMVAQFKKNMGLLYGNGPFDDQPLQRIAWIRGIAARNPERQIQLQAVYAAMDQMQKRIASGHQPDFNQARGFFERHWPIVRDEMTKMIWELWADLDQQKQEAVSTSGQLHKTLEATLREIRKISSAVRMTALNASIQAAQAGNEGKGFAMVASEIKNLAEKIQNSTDRAEHTMNILQK